MVSIPFLRAWIKRNKRNTDLWEVETDRYIPRISAALDRLKPALDMSQQIPSGPFSEPLSMEQTIAYHLALFARNGTIVVDQLLDNVGLLWSQGRMVGVSGLIRFALEYWAAVNFGLGILNAMQSGLDIQKAGEKAARLTFSGKTPVKLPWGGTTNNVAYSVLTFIDGLKGVEPEARDFYDFLCEASHPNFLQNTYFIMASRRYTNFSNESFEAHAHELLNKNIEIAEKAAAGMARDVAAILEKTLPMFSKLR